MKKHLILPLWILGLTLSGAQEISYGCGFWGDGDVGMITNEFDVTADGRPLREMDPIVVQGIESMRIPGNRGFSFVMNSSSQAIPYTRAVANDNYLSVTELTELGFSSVVDLSPVSSETRLHGDQSRDAGVTYFSIPVENFPPHSKRVLEFAAVVSDPHNFPLIVYAGNPTDLAVLWTAYRFSEGVGRSTAIMEGRELGMAFSVEEEMHWHLLNGKLAILRPANSTRE